MSTFNIELHRPHRADARRNFDALLAAARDAFSEQGSEASLEDIARRAGRRDRHAVPQLPDARRTS